MLTCRPAFVARVWHLDSSTMRRILLIEWFVDLRCLSHIDPERRLPTDLNELCFVSQDNIYYVRPVRPRTLWPDTAWIRLEARQ